jgi:FkbM family methyltransferase
MALLHRVLGAVSRRLDRPELLAAVDPVARQAGNDAIAINAVLASTLREGSVYVDVGTNRGQVLGEAVRIAPHARHIAFEPIPSLAEVVATRFPSVDCRRLALAGKPEVTQFCYFRKLDGWSGLRRSPEISDERGAPELIEVTVSTLDAELSGLTPSVIKIDVEGAELAVLEGGSSLLKATRPTLILEHVPQAGELYGASSEDLWDLLDGLAYTVYAITGEGPFSRAAFASERTVVNWLAVPAAQPHQSAQATSS